MTKNILRKLISNSMTAINDGTYDVNVNLQKSDNNLVDIIKKSIHPTIIAEIKFASPSLGKIKSADPLNVAKQMINGGAKALSILTQPYLFNGSPEYFIKVRRETKLPLLMKDIIIDKIQINAAKKIGADYILLIQSLFEQGHIKEIDEFIGYGHRKGLKILLEAHTRQEFKNALKTKADIIGINNRNLDTLNIDLKTTKDILCNCKRDESTPILSESGIESVNDIKYLRECGSDAFLVGSSIMKSNDIKEQVTKLVNAY